MLHMWNQMSFLASFSSSYALQIPVLLSGHSVAQNLNTKTPRAFSTILQVENRLRLIIFLYVTSPADLTKTSPLEALPQFPTSIYIKL